MEDHNHQFYMIAHAPNTIAIQKEYENKA